MARPGDLPCTHCPPCPIRAQHGQDAHPQRLDRILPRDSGTFRPAQSLYDYPVPMGAWLASPGRLRTRTVSTTSLFAFDGLNANKDPLVHRLCPRVSSNTQLEETRDGGEEELTSQPRSCSRTAPGLRTQARDSASTHRPCTPPSRSKSSHDIPSRSRPARSR